MSTIVYRLVESNTAHFSLADVPTEISKRIVKICPITFATDVNGFRLLRTGVPSYWVVSYC